MPNHPARQPLLSRELVLLEAPTQVWSSRDGDAGDRPIHGLFHGDSRMLSGIRLAVEGVSPECIGDDHTPRSAVFHGISRSLDTGGADPRVRVIRERSVAAGVLTESVSLVNGLDHAIETTVRLELTLGFGPLHEVKSGLAPDANGAWAPVIGGAEARDEQRSVVVTASDARTVIDGADVALEWAVAVPAHGSVRQVAEIAVSDTAAVVTAPADRTLPRPAATGSPALDHWGARAHGDLEALLLELPALPGKRFFAAGAPWFFTLFGRDSLISARFVLPLTSDIALDTLEVLASLQGTTTDPSTAEQPGKIPHEIRSGALEIPDGGVVLPPVYYGTIDATPLWIMLLHEAWGAGADETRVRALLPALDRALGWLRDSADADGDGFLEYLDESGHGLANQGWKDSGDSVRFANGEQAVGPIALCEVQGYACAAALGAAELLDAFGIAGSGEWRAWAGAMQSRFRERFWVERDGSRYPAIALDGAKQRVDALTSNIGHLLGTGLLNADEESTIARLLVSPQLSSGSGLRTMSNADAGYWPLSYHCGTVWPHDTAMVISGLTACGHHDEARLLADGLVNGSVAFDGRMPELYAGDDDALGLPASYPASCRPQAWAAAAVVPVLTALTRRP